MKKFIGFISLLIALTSPSSFAAQPNQMEVEQLMQKKKQLVLKGLNLSAEERAEFLPVYNAYQKELLKSNSQLVLIINEFAKKYDALTNVKAKELLEKWLNQQQIELNLKKNYVPKFEKVMSKKELMRYYQMENKLKTAANAQMIQIIPLAK
ncbi:MAG: hypothetical protein DRQ61_08310 [Gammaproteobacteria bacterium]|nr:MAG: hypothetical protein DRQ56_02880 [Gammaproteobacteria bacterium]RLA21633.1 MAG: hypothetical protein DRQ61_08310 [Gammaproteobacteria bacterium]